MINSLIINDVMDRGIPNLERIPIRVTQDYHLQNVWLGLGLKQSTNDMLPINDNLLWLGAGWVKAGDWIFVYTGKGEPKRNQLPNQENSIYTIHWNRSEVIFSSAELFPYLLAGSASFPPSFYENQLASALSQYGKGNTF
jgi:hypothetical protein